MIRICQSGDAPKTYFIINETAKEYEGVMPTNC